MTFTLTPRRWYAMLCVFADGEQHASPIWVSDLRAGKTGRGILELDFWHANYTEGVQDKTYALHVLRREPGYLLTEQRETGVRRIVLLSEVTASWLRTHFRQEAVGDLQELLDRECPHP